MVSASSQGLIGRFYRSGRLTKGSHDENIPLMLASWKENIPIEIDNESKIARTTTLTKPNNETNYRNERIKTMSEVDNFIVGGVYVNERNQLQEDSRILFNLRGRRDSFESMVYNREES